jgi:hypothetical protein
MKKYGKPRVVSLITTLVIARNYVSFYKKTRNYNLNLRVITRINVITCVFLYYYELRVSNKANYVTTLCKLQE